MRTLRLVALVGMLAACSGGDEPAGGGTTTTTTLSGSLAATDGRTGSLTLTGEVPSASVVAPTAVSASVRAVITLTGTVSLSDGTTATLTGTWDNVTGVLSVSGGGFSFSGTFASGALSGSFTGPAITGIFSLRVATTSAGSDVYCGTFTGREPEDDPLGNPGFGPDNGTWNLVVTGTSVDVIVLSDEGSPLVLGGTKSGQAVTIAVPGGGSASGTISGAADEFVKGNYTVVGGAYGTFQGSRAYCTATTQSAPVASITLNHPGIGTTGALGRLLYDSTLVFATAWDAAGNIVAAPQLTWGRSGPTRTNTAATPPGQKWLVPDTTGWANVQQIMSASVSVTSQTNPGATASRTLMVHTY